MALKSVVMNSWKTGAGPPEGHHWTLTGPPAVCLLSKQVCGWCSQNRTALYPTTSGQTRDLCEDPVCVLQHGLQHYYPNIKHKKKNTHPEQWAAMLRRPGSSWGFGALLKDTSVVVLKEERERWLFTPPPTIPAGPEIRTHNLWITSLTL